MRMCAIVLLGVVIWCGGCGPDNEDPSGYWYNPDRPLTTAVHDCRQCLHDARFQGAIGTVGPAEQKIFEDCMRAKGYRRVGEDGLGPDTETIQLPALGGTEPVAGRQSGRN
jgi:hypothetical protein